MRCKIISINHRPSTWEKKAIEFYSKQLPSSFKVSHIEIKPSSSKSMNSKSILKMEGVEILKHVDDNAHVILWDRKGKEINSITFAKLIECQANNGKKINFIIGGAYGSSDDLFKRSQLILSASQLTFAHRLFKIFLMEQIYRASAINRNHPYHK